MEYKEGNKSFIFSITNNKIYYNKNKYYIINDNLFGLIFGSNGFSIKYNYGYDMTKIGGTSFDVSGKEYVLAEKYEFSIKTYAVYQIELE